MENGQKEEGKGQPIQTATEGDEQNGPLVESLSMATEMDPTEIFALRAAMGGGAEVTCVEGERKTDRQTVWDRQTRFITHQGLAPYCEETC